MSAVPTISITNSQLYAVFGNWLVAMLGAGADIVQGQQNRIAMPQGNYIIMTLIGGVEALHKGNRNTVWTAGSSNPGTEAVTKGMKDVLQLDFYGPSSRDWAGIVSELVSTQFNFDYFATQQANGGPEVQPLFATVARNLALTNGESQYESRWSFDLHFQYNPTVTFPQDFMTSLDIAVVNIDAQYPPE